MTEPAALRRELRRFLSEVSPASEVRRLMETDGGYDPAVWRALAGRFGAPGLLVPARWGGCRPAWPQLAVVLHEMGRVLLCAPFLSTAVLATAVIVASGDDEAGAEVLPAIAAGDCIATVALTADSSGISATAGAGRWRLDGETAYVLDGTVADVLIVAARAALQSGRHSAGTHAGVSLFRVDGNAPGLTATPMQTMDLTRKLARLRFEGTPARLLGAEGTGAVALASARTLAGVALASEQVGVARRCLELSVEYARTRKQFGRPIGSFQAVKHACADMLVDVESATAAADAAARAAEHGPDPELDEATAVAQAFCGDACFRVAARTIQVHGALGVSWDHNAHLYFKRAASSRLLFGAPHDHRRALARRMGLPPAVP